MVRSEDPHAVQRRSRAFRRGQAAPDHLVLPQLEGHEQADGRLSEPRSQRRAEPAAPRSNNTTRAAQSRRGESPLRRVGQTPRGAARKSGSAPGGSGTAAILAARRLTGQTAPLGHARATLERYNPPPPPSRRPPWPHSRPQLRPPGLGPFLQCPTPSWRSSTAACRKGKERKGTAACAAASRHHPDPPSRGPRSDWLRAERDWGTQLSVCARGSGFRPWRSRVARPDRPCPVLCRQPGPLFPSPRPRACMVPIEGDLVLRDSVSRPPCWRWREGRVREAPGGGTAIPSRQ